MGLQGKFAVITGGSRGIGRAIVEEFAHQGASVFFHYRNSRSQAEELVARLRQEGCQVTAIQGDLTKAEDVQALFQAVTEQGENLDILVHNAGVADFSPVDLVQEEAWREMIDVHLTAAYRCCRQAIPLMVPQKQGKILTIGSIWGTLGASCEAPYAAAKGGLLAFTRSLARELAPSGICVNMISPGVIDTEMNGGLTTEEQRELMEQIPRGRFGNPEDIGRWAAYLASTKGDWITGQNVIVDGGFSLDFS